MSIDVSFLRQSSPQYEQILADATDSGRTVTGVDKVAQRLLLHLLTRKDSIPQSTAGCEFLDLCLNGNVTTENDVFVIFASSLNTVVQAIQAEQLDTDPEDEQLAGVGIENLQLTEDSASLNIVIRTVAGDKKKLPVPLKFILA